MSKLSNIIQCEKCLKTFEYKSLLVKHNERKRPCVPSTAIQTQSAALAPSTATQAMGAATQAPATTTQDIGTAQASAAIQDTGLFRTNTKEQYYTTDVIAKYCVDKLLVKIPELGNPSPEYIWLEPSAGAGAFVKHIPTWVPSENRIALDIEPAGAGITKQDYLAWTVGQPLAESPKKYVVFGNPPFGRQSCMAKAFIKKSCKFAAVIAFILPKSFVKPSMNRVFADEFHCIHTEDLPGNSFLLNGVKPYDVPCVFQIWQKQTSPRAFQSEIEPLGYNYVKHTTQHDIIFRRVGITAGKAYNPLVTPGVTYSEQSHYFISLEPQYRQHINTIVEKINEHVFPSNTVGPRSLSKSETNEVINQILANLAVPGPAALHVPPRPVT